jgi:hypothetical protein
MITAQQKGTTKYKKVIIFHFIERPSVLGKGLGWKCMIILFENHEHKKKIFLEYFKGGSGGIFYGCTAVIWKIRNVN